MGLGNLQDLLRGVGGFGLVDGVLRRASFGQPRRHEFEIDDAAARMESSRPDASLHIFAKPPATVTRSTGWVLRYFNIPPAKSPMSINAVSGRAYSFATAASEVEPVAPAT